MPEHSTSGAAPGGTLFHLRSVAGRSSVSICRCPCCRPHRHGRNRPTSVRATYCFAGMDALPIADASMDLVIAHGIWNLSTSDAQFSPCGARGRASFTPGCRPVRSPFETRLPEDATPEAEQTFIYRQFSGQPQCFLTESQLFSEMQVAGFERDAAVPFVEHNRPTSAALRTAGDTGDLRGSVSVHGKEGR